MEGAHVLWVMVVGGVLRWAKEVGFVVVVGYVETAQLLYMSWISDVRQENMHVDAPALATGVCCARRPCWAFASGRMCTSRPILPSTASLPTLSSRLRRFRP